MSEEKAALYIVVLFFTLILAGGVLRAVHFLIEQGGIPKGTGGPLFVFGGILLFIGMVIKYWSKLSREGK